MSTQDREDEQRSPKYFFAWQRGPCARRKRQNDKQLARNKNKACQEQEGKTEGKKARYQLLKMFTN